MEGIEEIENEGLRTTLLDVLRHLTVVSNVLFYPSSLFSFQSRLFRYIDE